MTKQLTYLVCPLNWGLGHASRMIPIVDDLLKQGHKVVLGGDGDALLLISKEFPELDCITISDMKVSFKYKWMILNLMLLIPRIVLTAIKEHRTLKYLCKVNTIDVIISDNRYGLWNKKIKSIFITHQIMVKLPKPFHLFEFLAYQIIKRAILQFNECWIPDNKNIEDCLSGDLSHKYPIPKNARFIGPISRYSITKEIDTFETYDIVAILSGPEPLRSQLETKLIKLLVNKDIASLIIQGKPHLEEQLSKDKVTIVSQLSANLIKSYISKSKLVICRSGYTSLMDLKLLKAKALLIPTPKQTEQEYLAQYSSKQYKNISQNNLCAQGLDIFDLLSKKVQS